MKLEPLYRLTFRYPESWDAAGERLLIAEGRAEGRIAGRFRGANRELMKAILSALQEADDFIKRSPGAAAEIFASMATWSPFGVIAPAGHRSRQRWQPTILERECAHRSSVKVM